MSTNLAIDIGGTKIHAVEYSADHEAILEHRFATTDFFHQNGLKDLENLFAAISQAFSNKTFNKLGLSINCPIKDNIVVYSSLLNGGEGIDVKKIAEKYFTFRSFQSDNDVFCMAKAELIIGEGEKYNTFLYVNLGTGIRPVYIENGTIIRGFKNLAGEISQTPIWVHETNSYWKADELLGGMGLPKLSSVITGEEHHGENFFNHENPKLVETYATYLSYFLHVASFFYNPEVIIIGGSLIKSSAIWLPKMKKKYFSFKPKFLLARDILLSQIDHPASIGAIL